MSRPFTTEEIGGRCSDLIRVMDHHEIITERLLGVAPHDRVTEAWELAHLGKKEELAFRAYQDACDRLRELFDRRE